jgi:hypothetical protein
MGKTDFEVCNPQQAAAVLSTTMGCRDVPGKTI